MIKKQSIIDTLKIMIKKDAVEAGYAPVGNFFERFVMSLRNPRTAPYDKNLINRSVATMLAWTFMHQSKVVLFSAEQMRIFSEIRKAPGDAVDYMLPFPSVFVQLDKPYSAILRDGDAHESSIVGFLLSQILVDWEKYQEAVADGAPQSLVVDSERNVYLNRLYMFAQEKDSAILHAVAWQSDVGHHPIINGVGADSFWRDLAVACIGYINCENVYLEKQGEVPEAVNRKREAKGKSRLEPYYVCRIKGVQHDSHATGEGSKHGIRYDVRGHFRRLDTGKTIWVRPHQRGLQNELYIPKVYKVEKGSKPQWKP